MLLEVSRAVSFFLSIVSLYWLGISAFFVPGTNWEERLTLALLKLAVATCMCFFSGILFCWPSRSAGSANTRLTATLPVQLFFWAVAGIAVLFAGTWYLSDLAHQGYPYVSDRPS
jgi:hypothetical protein